MIFLNELTDLKKGLHKYIVQPMKDHSTWHHATELLGFYKYYCPIDEYIEKGVATGFFAKEEYMRDPVMIYFFIGVAIGIQKNKYIPKECQPNVKKTVKKGKPLLPELKKKIGKKETKLQDKYIKEAVEGINKAYAKEL